MLKGSQQELMYKDECMIVDDNDCITGHASKYDAQQLQGKTAQGLQRLPVQLPDPAPAAAAGQRKDHVPKSVDQYMLQPPLAWV